MSSIKFIVGVDCSLRNCGVSILDNVGNPIADFNLTTANGMTDHDSVDMMVDKFFSDERLAACHASNTRWYFELILFGRMGKATARAEVIGAIKWNLRQQRHMIYGVEPKALNSFFAARHNFKYPGGRRIKGQSKQLKEITMQMCHLHENLYTRNDNIADARVAARYGYAHTFEKQRLSPTALSRKL